jgi:hypothetical protein
MHAQVTKLWVARTTRPDDSCMYACFIHSRPCFFCTLRAVHHTHTHTQPKQQTHHSLLLSRTTRTTPSLSSQPHCAHPTLDPRRRRQIYVACWPRAATGPIQARQWGHPNRTAAGLLARRISPASIARGAVLRRARLPASASASASARVLDEYSDDAGCGRQIKRPPPPQQHRRSGLRLLRR